LIGIYEYLLSMFLISILAGLIGALVGVGGGILVVPALTLIFGVPIQYAAGASIVSVIATSSGSATAYVRDRITNLRIGMFLEIGSATGAVLGAVTTFYLVKSGLSWLLFIAFGLILFLSAYTTAVRMAKERKGGTERINQRPNKIATRLKLSGEYDDKVLKAKVPYVADSVPAGFAVMACAGLMAGLLGVGGGVLKVIGMDSFMKLPFKVSTTTSNFMIGVTAAASTAIFYIGGYINPILAAPVAIGVVAGSFVGAKVMVRTRTVSLRWLFVIALIGIGIEMIYQGLVL
jgi:uncharacterized membrane protein YfcA